jgi:osmotically-inducible protein OsmY
LSLITKRAARLAVALLMVASISACAFGPRKSDAQRAEDKATADRVQAALDGDRQLYARHITVSADSGVVSLGGYVWTQPDLEEALRVAEGVQGVSKVVNDLELERGGISNSPVSR